MMGYVVLLIYSFNTQMLCLYQALCKALPIRSKETDMVPTVTSQVARKRKALVYI